MPKIIKKNIAFKRPILISLGMALLVIFTFFGISTYFQWQGHFQTDQREKLANVDHLFDQLQHLDQRQIDILTDSIEHNQDLQNAYMARDRQQLQDLSLPLFTKMKSQYDITHFYYMTPDHNCFLRVHHPERHSDTIDRYTMKQASSTGTIAAGIELGPYGTLTLRVVRPWVINGKIKGYLELGREIEHITTELRNILGVDLIFLIHKEHLNQEKWLEGMKMLGRRGSWGEIAGHVVIDSTLPSIPQPVKEYISLSHNKKETLIRDVNIGNKTYRAGFLFLKDAQGKKVGEIIVLHDFTIGTAEHQLVHYMLGLCVLLALAVYGFFFIYTGRLQKSLQYAYDTLTGEIAVRKAAEEDLRKHEEHLDQKVKDRTASLIESNRKLQIEIEEREKTEDSLRQQETQLQLAKEQWQKSFNAMEEIVTIQDADMKIIRANKAAYQLFAPDESGLVGKKCYEIFRGTSNPCPHCPVVDSLQNKLTHSEMITHERLAKIFHVSAAPIYDKEGNLQYLVHVARDFTEKKKLEEDLSQAHKMEAIGTLAGGIAHDFNNIISAILGFAELVKLDAAEGKEIDDDLAQVITAALRAKDLTKQILTFSRKGPNILVPVNPSLVVNESIKLMRASLPSSIEIQQHIDADTGNILGDSVHIQQIVMNLCTNALHAMENQKGILSVSLERKELSTEDLSDQPDISPGPFIKLTVSDTGHGMNEATLARIFEPFYTSKEVGKGTGMGLAVIYGIVTGHNGFIKVTSNPGQGSSFAVYLPVLQEKTPAAADSPHDASEQHLPLFSGIQRILIVDDEPLLVKINQRLLEKLGYAITATTDSTDALEIFRAHPEQFDLLITDQTMPNLSGSELAKEVMKIKPSLPIIMCTGHSETVSKEEALSMGIKKYVFKPIQGDELTSSVWELLNEKEKPVN